MNENLTKDTEFRLLVTGSRDWDDVEQIWYSLNILNEKLGTRPATLIHGAARGVDSICASHWIALGHGALKIGERYVKAYPADWDRHGKAAGPKRNLLMLSLRPHLVMAFRKGGESSRGTTHCINAAREKGYRVMIWEQ